MRGGNSGINAHLFFPSVSAIQRRVRVYSKENAATVFSTVLARFYVELRTTLVSRDPKGSALPSRSAARRG